MKYITRTIWILSLISLLTDTASEMLYPIMPLYLKSIGFSILWIGLLEGLAEATAGLSKGYFGKLSDHKGIRVPFVRWGYTLSALSKPMMALWVLPLWIFVARTMDRVGKGLRTGARDAILSDESTSQTKGKVFGFHRAMDTFGAVLGPMLALTYLHYYPKDYKMLFYIAFIPGLLAILTSLLLRDNKNTKAQTTGKQVSFFTFISYWKQSPVAYRRLVTGLLIFSLFNSSDVFLLLKMQSSGMDERNIIGIYIFYNLVYALFAFPIGVLADKVGLKRVFLGGLLTFACVYIGMGFNSHPMVYFGLFFLYGIYAAATEGIAKAWITNLSDKKDTATAIGTFTALQSILALSASTLAGGLWYYLGAKIAFVSSGAVALLVVCYLAPFPFTTPSMQQKSEQSST